jgi:hypothetical protein
LVKAVERGLLAVAMLFLVAGAFFTPQLVTSSASVEETSCVESPTIVAPFDVEVRDVPERRGDRGEPAGGSADGFTDLYGNEVTDAIATYTLDQSGSLYELHSPQTELPRLGIPKS